MHVFIMQQLHSCCKANKSRGPASTHYSCFLEALVHIWDLLHMDQNRLKEYKKLHSLFPLSVNEALASDENTLCRNKNGD